MNRAFLWLLLAAILLSGCAGVAPTAPSPSTTPLPPPAGPISADERAGSTEGLAVERQWLQSWFRGTPVVIAQRADGAIAIDVPRDFCFEPGQSKVKPALGAVLAKVAESLLRVPRSQVVLMAAPDDATGTAPLALQRAGRLADSLRARGVAAARLGKPSSSKTPAVQLRIEIPAT